MTSLMSRQGVQGGKITFTGQFFKGASYEMMYLALVNSGPRGIFFWGGG